MKKDQLLQFLDQFKGKNIAVIGDVMIDSYVWGKVNRVSPEAPVPIVTGLKREMRLGGAANVALNIKALGANPFLCGIIGCDAQGSHFKQLMKEQKLVLAGIISSEDRPTTTKTRIISDHHHLLRVDEEATKPVADDKEKEFAHRIKIILETEDIDAVIFEDYDKGAITPFVIESVVSYARNKGLPTLVDPKKRNYDQYKGVTLFKPNFKEFKEGCLIDIDKEDIAAISRNALEFIEAHQIGNMFITLAEKGIFVCNNEESHHVSSSVELDVADVSGAGDTVISIATLCLVVGVNLEDTAAIANLAGGLVCEKAGVVPITPKQLVDGLTRLTKC